MSEAGALALKAVTARTREAERLEFRVERAMTGNTFDPHHLVKSAWDRGQEAARLNVSPA